MKFLRTGQLIAFCLFLSLLALLGVAYFQYQIAQVRAFNQAVMQGKPVKTEQQGFIAQFDTAYWLAKNERYKEAGILFSRLLNKATPAQKSMVYYNMGNIFFRRGLIINGTNMTVRNEAEYLFFQAKAAYQNALRLNSHDWRARHNLDRLLTLLPATPTPGVGESDSPGLIMGNIPVGLP